MRVERREIRKLQTIETHRPGNLGPISSLEAGLGNTGLLTLYPNIGALSELMGVRVPSRSVSVVWSYLWEELTSCVGGGDVGPLPSALLSAAKEMAQLLLFRMREVSFIGVLAINPFRVQTPMAPTEPVTHVFLTCPWTKTLIYSIFRGKLVIKKRI